MDMWRQAWRKLGEEKRRIFFWQGLFLVFLVVMFYSVGRVPAPEALVLVFVVLLLIRFDTRYPVLEFSPFLLLLLSYQAMRGFAQALPESAVNISNLITWEALLFGGVIPSSWLQREILGRSWAWLLSAPSNLLYWSHFFNPLAFGLVLFRYRKPAFRPFLLGLMGMSFAGFVTYMLFPAAPPWWATEKGFMPVGSEVTLAPFVLAGVAKSGPNPLAAVPSMHCAIPLYIALVARRVFGNRALWLMVLPAGVTFAVVYLGHHYVIDALAGYAYAVVAYALTRNRFEPDRAPLEKTGKFL